MLWPALSTLQQLRKLGLSSRRGWETAALPYLVITSHWKGFQIVEKDTPELQGYCTYQKARKRICNCQSFSVSAAGKGGERLARTDGKLSCQPPGLGSPGEWPQAACENWLKSFRAGVRMELSCQEFLQFSGSPLSRLKNMFGEIMCCRTLEKQHVDLLPERTHHSAPRGHPKSLQWLPIQGHPSIHTEAMFFGSRPRSVTEPGERSAWPFPHNMGLFSWARCAPKSQAGRVSVRSAPAPRALAASPPSSHILVHRRHPRTNPLLFWLRLNLCCLRYPKARKLSFNARLSRSRYSNHRF